MITVFDVTLSANLIFFVIPQYVVSCCKHSVKVYEQFLLLSSVHNVKYFHDIPEKDICGLSTINMLSITPETCYLVCTMNSFSGETYLLCHHLN